MNKYSHFICITLLFLVIGCKEKEEVVFPENILSEESFSALLVDFALAESAATLNIKNVPVNKLDSAYGFDPLKENKIRRSQYDSTLTYYADHPALYSKVYENVMKRLSELESARSFTKDSAAK
jgi:hypothetical protein